MDRQKKASIKREYKERAPQRGVFRVLCTATGQSWVDASSTLNTIKNRVWFDLRMGSNRNTELQRAWNEHGPEAMEFEVVEPFPEDAPPYVVERLTQDRKAYWMEHFGASPCL